MSAHNYPGIPPQGYVPQPSMYPVHPPPSGMVFLPPPPGPVVVGDAQPMRSVVIAKGPSAPTAPVSYSSQVVPGLIDTLMMPATVAMPLQDNDPKPMVNVVYVGGLYSGTSSDFVINIMQKCGKLVNFKRHTDPSSGLLANFALCDFESPRGPYYAMECLANLMFGEGVIKVSCNEKVRGLVDAWVSEQLSILKKEHPDKTDEEIKEIFKAPEAELRQELENLIKYEVMEMQEGTKRSTAPSTVNKPEPPRQPTLKPETARSESSTQPKQSEAQSDIQLYTTREYSIHPKESARRSKFRNRQRGYDEEFRLAEREWESQEKSLLRKLHRIGTVKRSTRERLVQDDLKGFARSTSSRDRQREIELDLEDEREEAQEIASSETRCTIPIANPVTQPATVEPIKRELPTIFGSNVDEEEPMFKRTHRPLIKLGVSDDEVWENVPTTKEEVFAFQLDWDSLFAESSLMKFLEPWTKKCIQDLMGDDDAVVGEVMDFLNGRLLERPSPSDLLADVEQFLDSDSHNFVYEMWRRIIFHQLKTKGLFS